MQYAVRILSSILDSDAIYRKFPKYPNETLKEQRNYSIPLMRLITLTTLQPAFLYR